MGDNLYWLWMSLNLGPANDSFVNLMMKVDSPYDLYRMEADELAQLTDDETVRKLSDKRLNEAADIMDYCIIHSIGILTYADPKYPERLKSLINPPMVLYYRGKLPAFDEHLCIGVVGTRKMTEYGMRSCYKIAYELASAGAVVVSGMALGIDSVAHAGAIGGRGTTVAVLGCGIDVVYPKQHRRLRKYICQNGAVITAYHPATPAYKNHFPERNAIISALSEGTLIVEAPINSGALITADCAAEQSRTVYALPGSIEEPMSEGPNHLIKNGAVAITGARDILQYYFENHSRQVDPVKLRQGELSSDFDNEILKELGISAECHGKGSRGTPEALLKKLNNEINNNAEQNSDYYSVPKIKRINEKKEEESDKKITKSVNKSEDKVQAEPIKPKEVDESVLATLTEEQRRIFNDLPCDKPVSVDFIAKGGYNIGTLMAALTILEIKGLISSLPGGMYIRK